MGIPALPDDIFAEAEEQSRQEVSEARTPDLLRMIANKAAEVTKVDLEIEALSAKIDKLNEVKNAILQREMVDLFAQARMADTTIDGVFFSVEEYVKAAIPKEQRDAGNDWLEANEFGDLIKYTLTMEFGKDQYYLLICFHYT